MAVHPPCTPPSSPLPNIPPPTRYQIGFPPALEALLRPFDDALIRLCQRKTTGIAYAFSMSLTFFTAIETALIFPALLFALGYDAAAALCNTVLFTLAITSQIPKKFLHRKRPWMTQRALPIRTDKTSSFPSRAVVCAVVFVWLIFTSLQYQQFASLTNPFLKWFFIIVAALLASIARVNVGAHYPSDTIAGFVLAIVILRAATSVEQTWSTGLCSEQLVYSTQNLLISHPSHLATLSSLRTLFPLIVFVYIITIVSMQGFWVKCSYVYGLLLAPATFRATYLCASKSLDARMSVMPRVFFHGGLPEHVRVALFFVALLLFGMATRKRKGPFRILVFSVIYFGSLAAIIVCRLQRIDGRTSAF